MPDRGAALLLPSTLSLISAGFEEGPARNRALAVWGGAGATGLTLGALLGGVLTAGFGWPAVFFVNVPLAAFIAVSALAVIPRDQGHDGSRRFDLPGALTVTGGSTLLVYALVQGPESGWTSSGTLLAALCAVGLLVLFAVIEMRSADPLMPAGLLHNRSLLVSITITFVYMGTFGALPYFLTVLFQVVQEGSALQTARVATREQGVASGMASTTLNLGNAIGLALLIAVANAGADGLAGNQLRAGTAAGGRTAVTLAAAGMLLGILLAMALPRPSARPARSQAATT